MSRVISYSSLHACMSSAIGFEGVRSSAGMTVTTARHREGTSAAGMQAHCYRMHSAQLVCPCNDECPPWFFGNEETVMRLCCSLAENTDGQAL